jgi:nitrite reductase (NADH) small subunit
MAAKRIKSVVVATVDEVQPGRCKIVEVDGQSIGLYNLGDEYRAVLNVCPHAFAPICLGQIRGTTEPTSTPGEHRWHKEGEIVACPWHGWEFDLRTGETWVDRRTLKFFPVEIEGDALAIRVPVRSS